jgi:multiple sugar transport system substrate-binding protein
MDPYIAKDTKLDLNDVAPYFREFGQKVGRQDQAADGRW